MFGCSDFRAVQRLLGASRSKLGEILSAVEFVDATAMELTLRTLLMPKDAPLTAVPPYPLSQQCPFYVVVETAGSNASHDSEKLSAFLDTVTADGTVVDGAVAQDAKQARHLWRLREDVSVALSQRGHVYKYDLSFPLAGMYDLVNIMRERLQPWAAAHGTHVVGYGHLGDANLHLNISTPSRGAPYHEELLREIEPFVFEWTLAHGGSISAEHGLGQVKAAWLDRAKPAPVVSLMRGLKSLLDPKGILNPGKVVAFATH